MEDFNQERTKVEPEQAILVTGAAGGIGKAVVATLLTSGHHVLATDLSQRRLDALAEEQGSLGQLDTAIWNALEPGGAERIDQIVRETLGSPDALINLVGGMRGPIETMYDKPIETITLTEWQFNFDLNVTSAFLASQVMVPMMKSQRHGTIVNTASMAYLGSHQGMGNLSYDATKAAVVAFTRSLSRQLGPAGIRVNCVAPGVVLTEVIESAFTDEMLASHTVRTPLGKLATPGDIAETIRFLVSGAAGHVSGEVIHVAGGLR